MNSRLILQRLWHEPPVFFPVLALFHIFLLGRAFYDFSGVPFSDTVLLTLAWYVTGAALSAGVWLLKRWAAIGYMVLTAAGLSMNLALPHGAFWQEIGATLFPIDALMMVLIAFFYKRFR